MAKEVAKRGGKKLLNTAMKVIPLIDAPLEALMFNWYHDQLPKEDQARLHNWYSTWKKNRPSEEPGIRHPLGATKAKQPGIMTDFSILGDKIKEAGTGIFNYMTEGIVPPLKYEQGKPVRAWDPEELREAHPDYAIGLEIGLKPGDPGYSLRTKPYPLGEAVAKERDRGGERLGREANIPKSIRELPEYNPGPAYRPKY